MGAEARSVSMFVFAYESEQQCIAAECVQLLGGFAAFDVGAEVSDKDVKLSQDVEGFILPPGKTANQMCIEISIYENGNMVYQSCAILPHVARTVCIPMGTVFKMEGHSHGGRPC